MASGAFGFRLKGVYLLSEKREREKDTDDVASSGSAYESACSYLYRINVGWTCAVVLSLEKATVFAEVFMGKGLHTDKRTSCVYAVVFLSLILFTYLAFLSSICYPDAFELTSVKKSAVECFVKIL